MAAEEEGDFAPLVEQRRDIEEIPEWVAIFAVVEQKLNGFLAAVDGCSKASGGAGISEISLEEATVTGDYVFAVVTCDGDEPIRGIENRIICYTGMHGLALKAFKIGRNYLGSVMQKQSPSP